MSNLEKSKIEGVSLIDRVIQALNKGKAVGKALERHGITREEYIMMYGEIDDIIQKDGEHIFEEAEAKNRIIGVYEEILKKNMHISSDSRFEMEEIIILLKKVFDDPKFRANVLKTYKEVVAPAIKHIYN